MKKDYTHISMILDRSGSMRDVAADAIGGFNSFLADQKKVQGEATITLIQFDDKYEPLHSFKPIAEVPELDSFTFQPRGTTALRDAIGRTIDDTGTNLALMKEADRPEKVIVVVITDGIENASRHFSAARINEMIRHQTDEYNWQFVFMGSNQDAITSARSIGIAAASALSYDNTEQSIKMSYQGLSRSISNARLGVTKQAIFTDEDRLKIKK